MAAEAPRSGGERLRLLCSHGGRLVPCGPDGSLRYVGGETRALALPRAATFRDLAARLAEMAGSAEVREVRHHLADEELKDVLVSVTCDEELAHMRDEYDRLRTTRPAASFWVFVSTAASSSNSNSGGAQRRGAATGLPPRPPAPAMRRVHSDQEVTARAYLHRRLAPPAPVRRVQSAQELAGRCCLPPSIYHRRRERCGQSSKSKNAKIGVRPGFQEDAPAVPAAKATSQVLYRDALTPQGRRRGAETPSRPCSSRERSGSSIPGDLVIIVPRCKSGCPVKFLSLDDHMT